MIQLTNIRKTYTMKDHDIHALKDVNLSLDSTGFVFIVGPSGCGKTTLLNIIGGLDHPDEGSLFLNDVHTDDYTESNWNDYRNQSIGFVFQSFYLIPHLSILENVMMPLKLAGFDTEQQIEKAKAALKSVHLESLSHHKPNQLSGGQQQKAAIARALVNEPKIILADEPTGSLDHQSTLEIMTILKEISKDRLVLMVTHHEQLSKSYGDRIITMDDGSIMNDHVMKDEHHSVDKSVSNTLSKMSLSVSFMLSFKNLMKRWYRTLLIILAASIGMLGMTLVIAVAYGFDSFIELRKTETLNAFPIRVERVSAVIPFFDEKYQPNLPLFGEDDVVYPRNIQYEFQTINTLTEDYYDHVKQMDDSLYDSIHYNFGTHHWFGINTSEIHLTDDTFLQLPVDSSYLNTYFDLLEGRLPDDSKNEIVVIVDRYNRMSKDVVEKLGLSTQNSLSFEDFLSLDIKWLPNNAFYEFDGTYFREKDKEDAYQHALSLDIDVVGILRIKEDFSLDLLNAGFYYTKHLGDVMLNAASTSHIVAAQMLTLNSVLDGSSFSSSSEKESFLRELGYGTYPIAYTIYSRSFEDKDVIMSYLKSYNNDIPINDQIEPLDVAGIGLSTMRVAIDATTTILLVFSGISLLISNLMIGIMSYTSVIERTKEIGILRAIGARRKDIGMIFYAEALLIGFFAGVLGIILSYALIPLLNIYLFNITDISSLSKLPFVYALLLILMSTLLTSLFSILPARIASYKDPILCLRNE